FRKIYKLNVIVIPTHRDMIRKDSGDVIYKTVGAKYTAVAEDILERHKKGQPVLVGTTSIDKNEIISDYLKRKKIPHNVLNAKNHEREAMILADAGKPGGVTVATNMAGRGVDIILGGSTPEAKDKKSLRRWEENHKEVIKAGGLHVIGTERHESRRIDNQLRGRAGRQGDPGSSRFYLSLEDDLMRIFGGEQIGNLMNTLKIEEDQPIENGIVSKAIEQAQVKVEGFYFDSRKNVVDYDDVNNQQRDIIYKLRRRILEATDIKDEILEKLEFQVDNILLSDPDAEETVVKFTDMIPFDDASRKEVEKQLNNIKDKTKVKEFLLKILKDIHSSREKQVGESAMRQIEKYAYLGAIDHLWIDHIDQVTDLQDAARLRSYGQRDPVVEFKNEAFTLFENLVTRIDEELAHRIFRIQAVPQSEIPLNIATENVDVTDNIGLVDKSSGTVFEDKTNKPKVVKKFGRNDPCWCGSGKKFKKCHYPQLLN
ncbi:MAG: SEC-C metal-binding domain-containing protein, partial [Patescibacteria group bacterium]